MKAYQMVFIAIGRPMRMSDVAVWSIWTPFREASAISSFLKRACQSASLVAKGTRKERLAGSRCPANEDCCPGFDVFPAR